MSRLAVCYGKELCERREVVVVCSSGNGLYSLGKLDRLQGGNRLFPADHEQHDLHCWCITFCNRFSGSS